MLAPHPNPDRIQIKKVRYTHDAMIDAIIAHPGISQKQLGEMFGFRSAAQVSIIVNSDAFRERLAQRKAEIVDPAILATIQDRLNGLASLAIEKLMDKLENGTPVSVKDLTGIISAVVPKPSSSPGPGGQVQNNFVVHLPAPAATSRDWLLSSSQAPLPPVEIVENSKGD